MFELIQESLGRIIDDHQSATDREADKSASAVRLIATIDEAGMLDGLVAVDQEAPPIAWRDAANLFMLLGEKAADAPIADIMLGRALVASAGGGQAAPLTVSVSPISPLTIRQSGDGISLSGSLNVPWGSMATEAAVPVQHEGVWWIAVVRREQCHAEGLSSGRDSRGEPRALWRLDGVAPTRWMPWHRNADARLPGAAMRAAQIAGAMRGTLSLSIQYANDRVQFARPIGKNQAIQHNLALIAEHAALSGTAARLAWAEDGPCTSVWRVASAKALASDLAGEVAAIAHAVHGAIGFTADYSLHRLTRRLWQWRTEEGGAANWHAVVGSLAARHAAGAGGPTEGLWRQIVAETSIPTFAL